MCCSSSVCAKITVSRIEIIRDSNSSLIFNTMGWCEQLYIQYIIQKFLNQWYWRINTIVMDSLMYLLHSQVHKIHKTTFFNEKNIKKSIFSVWNTIFIHTRYNKKFNNIFNGHRFKVHTRIISFIPNKFWMFSNRTSEKIQFTQHRLICLSKIYIHSIKIWSSEILWTECKLIWQA